MAAALTTALNTAGFALAHAVGSIRLGGTLCTLAILRRGGDRILIRYEAPSIPESLALAHVHLADEIAQGEHAALVYDGFATTDEQVRSDAFVAEVLGPRGTVLGRVVQTYRPARRLGLPAIGRVCTPFGKPIVEESIDQDDPVAAIYEGVREHPLGVRLFGLLRQ